MIEVRTSDCEIKVTVDDVIVAELSSSNGLEGFIVEPDVPFRRMPSGALLDLAKFLIEAAQERQDSEVSEAERAESKEGANK